LQQSGNLIDLSMAKGHPALRYASIGDVDSLRELESAGFDLKFQDSFGLCLVYNAIIAGQVAVLEYLLASGEDPNRLMCIRSKIEPERVTRYVPLFLVRNLGAYVLLRNNGADLSLNIDGRVPLYFAFNGYCTDIIREMYVDGVRVNKSEADQISAMIIRTSNTQEVAMTRLKKLDLFLK